MMNCSVSNYIFELRLLELMEHRVRTAPLAGNALRFEGSEQLHPETWKRIVDEVRLQVKSAEDLFARLESHVLREHVRAIGWALDYGGERARSEIADKIHAIRNIIEIELRNHFFYHYPIEKVKLLLNLGSEWGVIIEAFPDTEAEITSGTDCYASGLDTACVFHMMRAAEIGLRSVAAENKIKLSKNKPLTHAQWGEILSALERRVKHIENTTRAGAAKDASLSYYSGAQSHLRALRDKYRNSVMHAKRSFGDLEPRDAMFHTRSFLSGLATGRGGKRARSGPN